MTYSDQLNELAAALATAQAKIKPAIKDSTNPHFRSGYASLQSVWDAAQAVLSPNGLSIAQGFEASPTGEVVTVSMVLLHKSGQWMRSSLTLKPSKCDPQGVGSAITYGRRYSLAAMLGIVADEDDDGNAASAPKPVVAKKPLAPDTLKQLKFLYGTPKAKALIDKVLEKHRLVQVDDMDEDLGAKTVSWTESELKKEEKK